MSGGIKKKYIELYLAKVKEFGFKPQSGTLDGRDEDMNEIVRYLLVNGNIPFTKENLAMTPKDFAISAGRLPKELKERLLKECKDFDWNYHEEHEIEQKKEWNTVIETIRIENSHVTDIRIEVDRLIHVKTTYDGPPEMTPIPLWSEEDADREQ